MKHLRYLKAISRSYGGWRGAVKYVMLNLLAKWKRGDKDFVADIARRQGSLFAQIGVSMTAAETLARDVISRLALPPGSIMDTRVHIIAFAALKCADFRPKHILELGTNSGQTARYLAELFPDAIVHTFELPPHDPTFAMHHPEGDATYTARSRVFLEHKNIKTYRANTLDLMKYNLPDFDIIWLDAGHDYPEVAWDHFFCTNKLAPNGWLFSDDIVEVDNFLIRHDKTKLHAAEVVQSVNKRAMDKFIYVPKRTEPDQNIIFDKYIAVLHRPI